VSNGQIDFQGVLQLVELIKTSSNFSEIRLRSGDVEVELRRNGGAGLAAAPRAEAAAAAAPREPAPVAGTQPAAARSAPVPAPAPATVAKPRSSAAREGATVIKSPMVGTVYHAPEPGAAPFVQLGQMVAPEDQICIVEVMKLMNSITAGCHGTVTEILVADGGAVEYGQELFVIANR
jgi:acetyl-CoA carboxylase biotin carboxyl carrier protein